jgi:hypothetical protein
MQLDWKNLKINGCPAFLRALKTIEETLQQQEAAITELSYLLSEEIMRQVCAPPPAPPTPSAVVAELGHGWQIIRSPDETITMAGTPADSWLRDDWVTQYVAAVDDR